MKNSNCVIAALLVAMFFTACGDSDGASANSGSATLEEVYASEDDLPGCTEKYEGAVAFVKEGSAAFKCEDGRWENKGEYYANNDAIKNCTSKREGEIAYIVDEDKSLVCQDGKWMKAEKQKESSSSTKTTEPAEGSSTSKVSSSSSWNEVTGSSSSSSRKDEQDESSSESKVHEPAEGSSSSNASSSSSWSEAIGSSSAQTPSSSLAEESSSSVASSSSFIGCKTAEVDNCEYGEILDERDGKKYKTVKIGDQWWMAENLNYEVEGQSYCYNNEPDNCAKYGRLYTWAAAVGKSEEECGYGKRCGLSGTVHGICPEGLHLPSDSEWNTLYSAMGGSPYAMQAKSVANWPDATDAYGFSALPAGYYHYIFALRGSFAAFWSASENSDNNSYAHDWYLKAGSAGRNVTWEKGTGFSVRCVKD